MPKTIHYLAQKSQYPACGQPEGRRSTSTSIPADVTCKGCLRSASFQRAFPDLAKPGKGRQRLEDRGLISKTVKLSLSPEQLQWLEDQPGTYRDAIVGAIEAQMRSSFTIDSPH